MLVATILPQPYLYLIKDEPYHLALAHLINKNRFEQYTKFYHEIGHSSDKFLILDNGLIEDDPRPIEELLEKALYLHADEMILPDVFTDMDETLREAHDTLEYVLSMPEYPRLMAVPQGSTYEKWIECAREMLTWPIDTLGIPKVLVKLGGRDARANALMELQEYLGDKQVHLLGCWESPIEIKVIENQVRQGKIRPVRGVDSAIAYVYAKAGLKISEASRPEGPVNFAAEDADLEILKYNIELWKSEGAALSSLNETGVVRRIWV